jgi:predicted GIY-YIG superfamily endonuclease
VGRVNISVPHFVYQLIAIGEVPFYVGISQEGIDRLQQHIRDYDEGKRLEKCLAIETFGADNIKLEIIERVPTRSKALEREQHHINAFRTRGVRLYNM